MADYWLDSNIFIDSKNGLYGFDLVPGFWVLLDSKSRESVIASSTTVYYELADGNDDLAQWVKERRESGLFVEPDDLVQMAFREIADYLQANYLPNQSAAFLAGADPWIIAHARAYGGRVVTNERRVGSESSKAKIPNVCDVFSVESVQLIQMLRELGASFS